MPAILVNGRMSDAVSASDRGLALGDGLFETIAVRRGHPRFWPAHYDRLAFGCGRLGIPAPAEATLRAEIDALTSAVDDGVVRLTVTRGPGPRGYAPPTEPTPTRILAFHPAREGTTAGGPSQLVLRWCRTRLAPQPALAGLKHLNRLEQVLARSEWDDAGVHEGLMCAHDGRVIEGVACNLFLVRGERLITPALDTCGVAGVVRRHVLVAAADLGIGAEVRAVTPEEVMGADGLFLTSAVLGMRPVSRVGERTYPARHAIFDRIAERLEAMD